MMRWLLLSVMILGVSGVARAVPEGTSAAWDEPPLLTKKVEGEEVPSQEQSIIEVEELLSQLEELIESEQELSQQEEKFKEKDYSLDKLEERSDETVAKPQPKAAAKPAAPVQKKDYWEIDVREQKIPDIEKNLKIDAAFKEAKQITLPIQAPVIEVEASPAILTSTAIIEAILDERYQTEKIDLAFDDTNLGDILLTLGEMSQMNIVLDPVLKANRLDLHLKDVSIKEALLLIANTYDLGFKQVVDSLFITKKEKLRDQNLTTKVIKLKNISAEEAQGLIKNLIDSVNVSQEINSLILVGEPEEIMKVQEIIRKVDAPQPQVILEAKIIEVNKDALKDLGVDWSDQIILSYQEGGRPVDFEDTEDSPDSPGKIFSFSRNPIQFDTIIKMLENQNKAKVLSNPRVTTLNDKEAEIFVGDRIPYTVTNVTGGVVTTDVRWVEPGIRLIITPTIIEDDFVVIKVEPEVSFIFAFRGPNDEFPHVKTREATAYVRVKDNQPFVLGGLLNQEDKKNLFKVPMLGDLPLLGNLFSYEQHTLLDTELIITIVPTIVHGDI